MKGASALAPSFLSFFCGSAEESSNDCLKLINSSLFLILVEGLLCRANGGDEDYLPVKALAAEGITNKLNLSL